MEQAVLKNGVSSRQDITAAILCQAVKTLISLCLCVQYLPPSCID